MSTIERLADKGLVKPPRWLPRNVAYETIMGSVAFGVSGDTSDMDIYAFAIPPQDDVFPHLRGEVAGFGTPAPRFEQFEAHHVVAPDLLGGGGRTHDLTIYSIVKFFQLAMENNPNIIDALFTPVTCVLHWPRRVKPLLYTYRVLLTGIRLMRTGAVEANLVPLAAEAKLGFIDDLVARKVQGKETETLPDDEADFHAREIGRLTATLLAAAAASTLPERPTASPALHDLLVRLRLGR